MKIAISPLSHRALSAIRADQNQRRKRKPCPHEEPKTTIAEIKARTGMDLRTQTRASHSIDDENTDGALQYKGSLEKRACQGKTSALERKTNLCCSIPNTDHSLDAGTVGIEENLLQSRKVNNSPRGADCPIHRPDSSKLSTLWLGLITSQEEL